MNTDRLSVSELRRLADNKIDRDVAILACRELARRGERTVDPDSRAGRQLEHMSRLAGRGRPVIERDGCSVIFRAMTSEEATHFLATRGFDTRRAR